MVIERVAAIAAAATFAASCSFAVVRGTPARTTDGNLSCNSAVVPFGDLVGSALFGLAAFGYSLGDCDSGECSDQPYPTAGYVAAGGGVLALVSAMYGFSRISACNDELDAPIAIPSPSWAPEPLPTSRPEPVPARIP